MILTMFRKKMLITLMIGVGVVGLILYSILRMVLPIFAFPKPTGKYAIGTVTYHFVDTNRPEIFTTDSKYHDRELTVQIWYPVKNNLLLNAPYIQDSEAVTKALARLHNFPDFSFKHLKYVETHTSLSVPVVEDLPNYPVLIFLEGLTGYRQMNTFQVEELVSHGYIVVGIDQPGIAATVVLPDGRQIIGLSKNEMEPLTQQSLNPSEIAPQLNGQIFKEGVIPYFAKDVSFVLDQLSSLYTNDPNNNLTDRLDLQKIGMFGVSFGGIVGAEACLKDTRIKACLMEDVAMPLEVVQKGLKQPSMWITRNADSMRLEREKAGGWTEADIEQTQKTQRAVFNGLEKEGYLVQVPGMFHVDLTDLNLVSPFLSLVGLSGPIGAERAHNIINAYSLGFFDTHLKGKSSLLKELSKEYPEVLLETRP